MKSSYFTTSVVAFQPGAIINVWIIPSWVIRPIVASCFVHTNISLYLILIAAAEGVHLALFSYDELKAKDKHKPVVDVQCSTDYADNR